MSATCPRLFEVEALRDGRLQGAELARFQAHLGVCPVCARETEALEALATALRAPDDSAIADELHVRRERTRLLAAFDARLMPAARSNRTKLRLGIAVAAALSVLAALTFVLWPAPPIPVAAIASTPSSDPVTIRADSSARWSRQVEAQLEKITLQSGALSIRVTHAVPARRLLVILPDGELEDIGTTFSVSADAGHTTRVTVQEGSVVLRLHGKPPLALGAGDSWSPSLAPPATPLPSTSPPAPPPNSRKIAPFATSASAPLTRNPETTPLDPSADFRAAMSAFNTGDNTLAASRFAAFLAQHPRDPRAQDAAYLRILALQRSGNASATRQAAQDYLSRYPRGFRRAEVEALSR